MRIHTNLTWDPSFVDVAFSARKYAGLTADGMVFMVGPMSHGSRTHRNAFEVRLTGDGSKSKRRTNPGTPHYRRGEDLDYAATWSQWGHFLGYLFAIDPTIKCGPYADANDFHRQTAGVFRYDGSRSCHEAWDADEVRSMANLARTYATTRQEI